MYFPLPISLLNISLLWGPWDPLNTNTFQMDQSVLKMKKSNFSFNINSKNSFKLYQLKCLKVDTKIPKWCWQWIPKTNVLVEWYNTGKFQRWEVQSKLFPHNLQCLLLFSPPYFPLLERVILVRKWWPRETFEKTVSSSYLMFTNVDGFQRTGCNQLMVFKDGD